jgi:hypothetical protein
MLSGLGRVPQRHHAALDQLLSGAAEEQFAEVRREAGRLAVELPSQYEYLAQLHG